MMDLAMGCGKQGQGQTARKLLLVEGKDIKFLSQFHQRVFPDADLSLESIPNMPIGGWTGWPYAVGSAMLLRNSGGEAITTYCLLDSDYFSEEEKGRRIQQAIDRNVELHIWARKEIENYLLVPAAIHRLISFRMERDRKGPSIEDIEHELENICETLKHDTVDTLAQHYYNQDKPAGIGNANKRVRLKVDRAWKTLDGRLSIVSGKEVLSHLSAWSKEKYGISFGAHTLAQQIRAAELVDEVVEVIRHIHLGRSLIKESAKAAAA